MFQLNDKEKVSFRKWIKSNWNYIVGEISSEARVDKTAVMEVVDSLRCYLLFTEKDKDQSCMLHSMKKAKK